METNLRRKSLVFAASILSAITSISAQNGISASDPLSNFNFPGLGNPTVINGVTFLFVWIVAYAIFALLVKIWVEALNNASPNSWGDELSDLLFGSSGGPRSTGSKNLLIWITGLGMIVLVVTVPDFLGTVRTILAGLGIGGLYLLGLFGLVILIAAILALTGFGGQAIGWTWGKAKPQMENFGSEVSDGVSRGASGAKDLWEKAREKAGRLQQILGRNSYIRQGFKKFDELQDRAGWTVKFCPQCNQPNDRMNNNCTNCGRNFYFG